MSTMDTMIERAMVEAAMRVLRRRADALRTKAAIFITTTPDKAGREVPIVDPQARVALGTAALLDEAAADLSAMVL